MKAWSYQGLIFVSGAPAEGTDVNFDQRMYGVSSIASYHKGHKRWRLPLTRDVVDHLRTDLGLTIPKLGAWEREQAALEGHRAQANKFKALTRGEALEKMTKIGVRMKLKLFTHQLISVLYGLRLPACGLFLDTGTGKTAVAATIMQALVDKKAYKRMLVIAPKSILEVGWGRDLDKFSWLSWINISNPPAREPVTECPQCHKTFKTHVAWAHMRKHMAKFVAVHGATEAKRQLYLRYPQLMPPGQESLEVTECPICANNTKGHVAWKHMKTHFPKFANTKEGRKEERAAREELYARHPELQPLDRVAKRVRLKRALASNEHSTFVINPEAFKNSIDDINDQDWDMVIVDESSMLKSPRSQITKAMIGFGNGVRRRICMTATPRPNDSMDLWGQTAFLDQCLGGDFYRFREHNYYKLADGYTWTPKDKTVDHKIFDIVRERSYRVRLEDCVDLPGETTEQMAVVLDGSLKDHYNDMVNAMSVKLKDGKTVDTSWKIVQLNKLAQITSGYIFDNDGKAQFLEHSPKIDATFEMAQRLIESEDRFVVIWVRFPQTEGDRLQEMLSKYGVSTLHGHTRNQEKSVDAFLQKKNRVMIAHVQSAKFGHTWTHANAAIFHSYDYSWENFYQAKRRIYRIGQQSPVTYLVCTAIDTVDEVILKAVFHKEKSSDAVVDEHVFTAMKRQAQSRLTSNL